MLQISDPPPCKSIVLRSLGGPREEQAAHRRLLQALKPELKLAKGAAKALRTARAEIVFETAKPYSMDELSTTKIVNNSVDSFVDHLWIIHRQFNAIVDKLS